MGSLHGDERWFHEALAAQLEPFAPTGLRPREVDRVASVLAPGSELPAAYRAFLRLAGRACGVLWVGSDAFVPRLLGVREGTEELLAEDGGHHRLGPTDVPFLLHQGYDAWYLHGPGPDPEVWRYTEGADVRPVRIASMFTELVAAEVRALADGAVVRVAQGWSGQLRWCLKRTEMGSALELVRAVEQGWMPPTATYLERGHRYEVLPGPRLAIITPEGQRYEMAIDPITGAETSTATAEDVHASGVPVVHVEAALARQQGGGPPA